LPGGHIILKAEDCLNETSSAGLKSYQAPRLMC